jgi:hypothetical protein
MSRTLTALMIALLITLTALTGCSPRRSRVESRGYEQQRVDSILVVVVDLSGSFVELFKPDGKATAHLLEVIQNYFHARIGLGKNDRLIIAQISGSTQPIVFEGSPREFHEQFGSATELRKLLLSKADPSRSRVYDSISDAIEHALDATGGVEQGHCRMNLLVLSDMDDNASASTGLQRLDANLRRFHTQYDGVVGLHWLPPAQVRPWAERLRQLGFPATRCRVTGDTLPSAPLPNF